MSFAISRSSPTWPRIRKNPSSSFSAAKVIVPFCSLTYSVNCCQLSSVMAPSACAKSANFLATLRTFGYICEPFSTPSSKMLPMSSSSIYRSIAFSMGRIPSAREYPLSIKTAVIAFICSSLARTLLKSKTVFSIASSPSILSALSSSRNVSSSARLSRHFILYWFWSLTSITPFANRRSRRSLSIASICDAITTPSSKWRVISCPSLISFVYRGSLTFCNMCLIVSYECG